MDQCLEHCGYVGAILPESFIHDRTLPFAQRLQSVIELNCRMFEDTDQPVCLALFGPESNDDFLIYRMNLKLGAYSTLKHKLPEAENTKDWVFNHPNGEIALKAIDDTSGPTIAFDRGQVYSPADIKVSSRLFTRIKVPSSMRVQHLIKSANDVLGRFRLDTGDVFLTAFKGLRKDGMFRRRLDYSMARNILNAAWKLLVDLRANYGTTLFFTTHYLEEAESHCDRMAIMHLGKVAALGTCHELEASLGDGAHTLNDVFVHYAGSALDAGGSFRDVSAERATAQRLG